MKKVISLIVLIAIVGCNFNQSEVHTKTDIPAADTIGISAKAIDDLHKRLTLKQYDIGLAEYIKREPHKVDSIRKVIYLMPFGNMKPEVEAIVKSEVDYLKAFFQLDVKMMDRMPYDSIKNIAAVKTRLVPADDFDYYSKMKGGTPNLTEQIQATSFMDSVLKKKMPKDAIAVLGITEHDIYDPKYNYLFGSSDLLHGVGVMSTFRLIDYGEQTKDNIRKVISKQVANMFSLPNVRDYECLLNFHNDSNELADGDFNISPRALEKLKFAIGFDYQKRSTDLQAFWAKEQNKKQENYYAECLKRFKPKKSKK